ncbi:hypothetical protein QFC20_006872 [Naganishia adeliensis]|uniref:Uncharacterized protein n=1 Tax=Naganishia adeliensis TaxID=92952 RepID=A0ACC2V6D7_9TREE|nr:hypothetical protein QFC20_006872 [Naganishia adeliensis]
MDLLAFPNEILNIIVDFLNGPDNPDDLSKYEVSTACFCKQLYRLDSRYSRNPEAYPIWPEWKRDSFALSSVCKRMRSLIFDQRWLRKTVLDWDGVNLSKSRLALCSTSREKVKILVLRADCNASIQRPNLISFAELFPNLEQIQLDGVYPELPYLERTGTSVQACDNGHPRRWKPEFTPLHPTLTSLASLPPISISTYRATNSNVTNHEPYTSNLIRQFRFCAGMGDSTASKIETLHVEFPLSRSRDRRRYGKFWDMFCRRMKGACNVPATTVNICIPAILVDGEIRQFLNALSAAIQTWPEHVRNIAFVLRLEDFIWPDYEHKLMSKNHGEPAKVSTEYLPTKDDMDQFLGQLAKLRTGLKHFSLVIYTTVDRLYESWIEDCRYYSDDYHNPAEYREEREMDTECREDAANEAAFGLLSDEELETYWE